MSIETENPFEKARNVESSAERREAREVEKDPELEKAAAMERADFISKEIKSSKKQIQNIVLNMQQVQQAIRQLRAQLQLADDGNDPSLARDKEKVEMLKKKIADYSVEMEKMRGDLVREQIEELKNGIGVGMSSDELQKKAEEMVERMIKEIKV